MSVAKRLFALRAQIAVSGLAWVGLWFCVAVAAQSPEPDKGDSWLRFVSPTEGQRFTPGDTVHVVVRATLPLAPIYAGVEHYRELSGWQHLRSLVLRNRYRLRPPATRT